MASAGKEREHETTHGTQSPANALIALFGLGGIACFSFALIQKRPFDASLAAVLVMLCWHIYSLQNEHRRRKGERRKQHIRDSGKAASGLRAASSVIPTSPVRGAADGTSELDLTGYATRLGVSVRGGGGGNSNKIMVEGSTLNKMAVDALAKEYLRCASALKSYQAAFGPLEDDDGSEPAAPAKAPGVAVDSRPEHLGSLSMDLAGLTEEATARTPRSPAGPPSPDPKRCRPYSQQAVAPPLVSETSGKSGNDSSDSSRSEMPGGSSSAAGDGSGPSSTIGPSLTNASVHAGSGCSNAEPAESNVKEAPPAWQPRLDQVHSNVGAQTGSFGIFGGR